MPHPTRGRAAALVSLAALVGLGMPGPSRAQTTLPSYTARSILILADPTIPGPSALGEVTGLDDAGRVVGWGAQRDTRGTPQGFVTGPDGVGLGWIPALDGLDPRTTPPSSSYLAFSKAYGINNQGMVVGSAYDAAGRTQAFMSLGTSQLAGLRFLPGGTSSVATAVNDAGWIAGYGTNAAGLLEAFITGGPFGSGGLRGLGFLPGGTFSIATDINAAGRVVGYGDLADGQVEAFITGPNGSGGLTRLGVLLGGTESRAHAINDAGQVVGEAVDASGRRQAFITGRGGEGGLTGLGFLPGGTFSVAYDISPIGRVVGQGDVGFDDSQPTRSPVQAFVTAPDGAGGLRELNARGLPTAYDVTQPTAINAEGQIAAEAWRAGGGLAPPYAVLLTPDVPDPPPTTVPEPGTVALLATGLLCVAGVARRRR